MRTTFMNSPSLVFTSESVTEGHPDKMCDQISDAVLDACLAQDPKSRVACEVATKTGFVMLLGEITTLGQLDFDTLARKVITDIGYDDSSKGFDGNTCAGQGAVAKQSCDIAMGVIHSYESRSHDVSDDEVETQGSGVGGMICEFRYEEALMVMPLPIHLAHRLT